jgi:hypothetical protein
MHALFLRTLPLILLICNQKKWGELRLYAHHNGNSKTDENRFLMKDGCLDRLK